MSGPDALGKIPVRHAEVAAEVVGEEVLLYHPQRTQALYLNVTSGVIWGLCDGHRSVGDMIDLIQAAYPDTVDAAADVQTTLNELEAYGVLAFT